MLKKIFETNNKNNNKKNTQNCKILFFEKGGLR